MVLYIGYPGQNIHVNWILDLMNISVENWIDKLVANILRFLCLKRAVLTVNILMDFWVNLELVPVQSTDRTSMRGLV